MMTFNHRFPGQYRDGETGLLQNWNREYDPKLGRYTASDPMGLDAGTNTFIYAVNDPLSRSDKNGLWASTGPDGKYNHFVCIASCFSETYGISLGEIAGTSSDLTVAGMIGQNLAIGSAGLGASTVRKACSRILFTAARGNAVAGTGLAFFVLTGTLYCADQCQTNYKPSGP